ncbi:MAG TPA: energy-coupling factor transporter ATPase [Anaerolineaceae bacterium]|nr:energy-coupling factor transporter ATPase [Anaerolineaceae bacterium]
MRPLVVVDRLTYRHPGSEPSQRNALDGVSLQIEAGEYVALIGSNGSGKTTLARHLNALLVPAQGTVLIDGLDTRDRANYPRIRSTVGMVFQRPEDQMIATTVEEDVAFGPENLGLPPDEIRRRVEDALEQASITALRHRPPYQLSAGQMQRVALAGVLAMRPACIIFDEATAMLDPRGRETLLSLMRDLHQNGTTIIHITHFMEEAAEAGRVLVMHAGQIVMDGTPAQIFARARALSDLGLECPPAMAIADELRPWLPSLPAGVVSAEELLAAIPPAMTPYIPQQITAPPISPEKSNGFSAIEVNRLSHWYGRGTPFERQSLDQVTMKVAGKSAAGLAGATGSGKTTLLQHLNGLYLPQQGTVRVGAHDLNQADVDLRGVRRYSGLLFQIPENHFFEEFVGDEIAYGPRLAGLKEEVLRQRVRETMEALGLPFEAFKDRRTYALSGGERRKVALALVLAAPPEILLLDEPTAGLDPASRRDVLALLRRQLDLGKTLVISSHRMTDLAELAGSITILQSGRLELDGPVHQVFRQEDQLRQVGLRSPLPARVSRRLHEQGWPVSPEAVTTGQVVESLRAMHNQIPYE